MTQRQSFGVLIAHGVIALALITAASVLAGLHVLDASAVTAIFGAVIGFVGGAGIAQGSAIINGGPKPDLTRMMEANPELATRYLGRSMPPAPAGSGETAQGPAKADTPAS